MVNENDEAYRLGLLLEALRKEHALLRDSYDACERRRAELDRYVTSLKAAMAAQAVLVDERDQYIANLEQRLRAHDSKSLSELIRERLAGRFGRALK